MSTFSPISNEEAMKFANPDYVPQEEDLSLPITYPPIPVIPNIYSKYIFGEETAKQISQNNFYTQKGLSYIVNGLKILERYKIETPIRKYEDDISILYEMNRSMNLNLSREKIEQIFKESNYDLNEAANKIIP